MKQTYFDVLPPVKPPRSTKFKEWIGFLVSALVVFAVLMAGSAYTRGGDWFQETTQAAFAGYERLEKGIAAAYEKDFTGAGEWFLGAQNSFNEIAESALFLSARSQGVLKTGHYSRAAENLLQVGARSAKLGADLAFLADESQALWGQFVAAIGKGKVDPALAKKIQEKILFYETFYREVIHVQNLLADVPTGSLPPDLAASVEAAQQKIGQAIAVLRQGRDWVEAAKELMGDRVPHTLLVLFQNNHERRATGGFIGSYALVEFNDFAVTHFEIKDVYESDGQLTEVIPAPPGISKVADRLYMRDANYSPDFPTSARLIADLLEKSRGPTVDTVMAIDQNVLESVLQKTGPVFLPAYGVNVSSETLNSFLSLVIESKLTGAGDPKRILRDLWLAVQQNLAGVNPSDLTDLFKKLTHERRIQIYSSVPAIQSLADTLGVSGRFAMPAPGVDFLAVITTAIGGNKSDGYIQTNLAHETSVALSGELTNHLTIEKTHTWSPEDWVHIQALQRVTGKGLLKDDTLRYIMGEGPNMDYMRVYVPKGSTLVDSEGIEKKSIMVGEDLGYTVFAFNFGPVAAGAQKTVTLEYALPFSFRENPVDYYRLVTFNQAGADDVTLLKTYHLPDGVVIAESFPETTETPIPLTSNTFFLTALKLL